MSDKSFTLLEIRLGDGQIQIGPKSLGRGGGVADSLSTDDDGGSTGRSCPCPMCEDGCDCLACKLGKIALVLGLLAALAVVAWKVLGGGEFDGFDEIEDDVDELID